MCGIAGIIQFDNTLQIDENYLRKMSAPLQFRGPDQEGYYVQHLNDITIGLAHKRLSIIDLSENGRQPMSDNEDKLVIVFNGEIYNYRELKKELKFTNFRSNSDTEIVLYAIKEWGIEKTLKKLEGMFAFALFDKSNLSLILARDRFGEKPLYYSIKNNTIAFSSDIRSFKVLPYQLTIDYYSLSYYFSELCTPINRSIYKEVKKLEPSCYLEFKKLETKIQHYSDLNYSNKNKLTEDKIIEHTEYLIENAVKKTLVSDVPVGCFLSGGIDSSLIALYAAQNYGRQIETFSIGFEYEPFNELPFAREVAKKIDSKHHEIILNPNDLSIVDSLIREYGEPFADSSAIPTYYVSKFASQNIKVALGGDGGDELFAGYPTYNQGRRMQQWSNQNYLKIPLKILSNLTNNQKIGYLSGVLSKNEKTIASALYRNMGFNSIDLQKLLYNNSNLDAPDEEHLIRVNEAFKESNSILDCLLHASIRTRLVNDYLVKTDRASMYNSLELRTPFLDNELANFVRTIPDELLMKRGINKYITKKIAEKHFTKDFIYREKQGFGIPIGLWLKKEWKKQFQEVVFSKQALIDLNYDYIEKLFSEHVSNQKDHTHRLWAIYVFHKWVKQ